MRMFLLKKYNPFEVIECPLLFEKLRNNVFLYILAKESLFARKSNSSAPAKFRWRQFYSMPLLSLTLLTMLKTLNTELSKTT